MADLGAPPACGGTHKHPNLRRIGRLCVWSSVIAAVVGFVLGGVISLGMRPLMAHCHLGLRKVYRRAGELELAHEHFATATGLYRTMNMRFWMERAEAEITEEA